ncbi:conserved hypothetical protein [Synechococcus sp. WH 8103]|nr:conserved hypothetical protein [Synechococcus sp. WH 8103]
MTDRTLSIATALREAQLQYLEASLASKSDSKPQPLAQAPKDNDELDATGR